MAIDFYDRFRAFADTLQPNIAIAYLQALRGIATGYKESAVEAALALGDVATAATIIADEEVTAIELLPVREAVREALIKSAIYIFRDTPKGIPAPTRTTAVIRFNALDPRVTQAAEAFESPLLDSLGAEIKDGVTAAIQAQLAEGIGPRTVARGLRDMIGLSGNQVTYLRNYRAELEELSNAALDRVLTDGRYDRSVARAIRDGTPLTAADVDRYVSAYAKNLKAQHAETITRTASINALKEGQRMAWQQAIDAGKVKADDLIDTWHTTLDGRERPAHHLMHLKTKRFSEKWMVPGIGPQDYPGQSEYNCRCVVFTRPRIRRASDIAAA